MWVELSLRLTICPRNKTKSVSWLKAEVVQEGSDTKNVKRKIQEGKFWCYQKATRTGTIDRRSGNRLAGFTFCCLQPELVTHHIVQKNARTLSTVYTGYHLALHETDKFPV